MIARTWRGVTRAEHADVYMDYLEATGLNDYRATPGFGGLQVLRRIADDRAEFVLITFWDSWDAIRAFAGDVYRGFDAASADEETIGFAQDHLRILSGLYGVLRPLDASLTSLVERIEIGGVEAQVRTVEIFQADGDRSVMTISPAPAR